MNALDITARTMTVSVVQILIVVLGSPVLVGLMRLIRARMEGRVGGGVLQPWRDTVKLLRKQRLDPEGTGPAFRTAPLLGVAVGAVAAAAVPLVATGTAFGTGADMIAVIGLLALASAALALAGLDTATAFGGMGASREMTIAALAEPTILMAIFALSARVGSTNLPAIVAAGASSATRLASPASLLAAVALAVVVLAECGRLPVDNPATHLELTMVHEAMVLEYSGPDLALVELGAAMRLTVLLGLWSSLFLPFGIATGTGLGALLLGLLVFAVKTALLGCVLAAGEVFMAKLRLFRVPELLAGSFLLGVLAVAASFFLT
ncbi:MAG TPA: NADH-quinone oxidoreductase subunit H [Actinospica sp.]|nr:NADH-quinone oxidoreductase subunit H [Actinospica sp.]